MAQLQVWCSISEHVLCQVSVLCEALCVALCVLFLALCLLCEALCVALCVLCVALYVALCVLWQVSLLWVELLLQLFYIVSILFKFLVNWCLQIHPYWQNSQQDNLQKNVVFFHISLLFKPLIRRGMYYVRPCKFPTRLLLLPPLPFQLACHIYLSMERVMLVIRPQSSRSFQQTYFYG